jgi:hypothetical protein
MTATVDAIVLVEWLHANRSLTFHPPQSESHITIRGRR